MTKDELKNRVLNGGRGSGQSLRLLVEVYENQIIELQSKVDTLQGFLDHDIEYDMDKTIQEQKIKIKDLEKELEAEKKLNEEIKVRFVKCNTCTDEMKNKCLMFSENLCEGDRCEELVDLMELINKSDLQRENAELRKKCLSAQDAVTMQMYTNKVNKEIADKKLAKAKELLAKWVELYKPKLEGFPKPPIQVDTEQFLSEVEK